MANNSFGTLGGAYSILGQATTAEYNRRKREEDKARRRARKDQLLAYFAQPLLKGAGEALAGGVSDLFGRAVLGPNAANYFDTEEGMIVKSKALAADAQERRLGKRLSALDGQKGRSRQENNRDLFWDSYVQEEQARHPVAGEEGKSRLLQDLIQEGTRDEVYALADKALAQMTKEYARLGKLPDVSDIQNRMKNADHYWGQGQTKRAFRKLISGGGKDPAIKGTRYLLTGTADPNNVPEWYLRFMDDGFEQTLTDGMKETRSLTSDKVWNALNVIVANGGKISEGNMIRAKRRLDSHDLSERKAAITSNLFFGSLTERQQKGIKSQTSVPGLNKAWYSAIGGFTPEEMKNIVSSIEGEREHPAHGAGVKISNTISEALYNEPYSSITKGSASDVERKYRKINTLTKEIFQRTARQYNKDLKDVLSEQGIDIRQMSRKALSQLKDDYMAFQLEENITTSIKTVEKGFNLLGIGRDDTEEISLGVFKDTKAGYSWIRARLSSSTEIEKLNTKAASPNASPSVAADQQASQRKVKPYKPAVKDNWAFTSAVDDIIENPRLSDEDRIKEIGEATQEFIAAINTKALDLGYVKQDDVSVANIHPSTILEISEYYEEVYNRIENYPVVPTWNQSSNPADILYGGESW